MATAQQLLGLIRSHANGDEERFLALTVQLASAEEGKGHLRLAAELRDLAVKVRQRAGENQAENRREKQRETQAGNQQANRGTAAAVPLVSPRGELAGLLSASYPRTRLNHMILDDASAGQLTRLVQEHRQRSRLHDFGLAPRSRVLLAGPPGCGKTMTASALAGELGLPLFTVLLHGVMTRYMGESASRLRMVFDAVSQTRGVYLFDELDAIGSQRGAGNDVGEARRVLNSFLQFLEEDAEGSIIIAATNHPELLDRALFRRFDLLMEYHLATASLVIDTIRARLIVFRLNGIDWQQVGEAGSGLSHADIIRAAEDAARDAVLAGKDSPDTASLVQALARRKSGLPFPPATTAPGPT